MTNPSNLTISATCSCGNPECSIPRGSCHCGCGKSTTVYQKSDTKMGQVKGQPARYLGGHAHKTRSLADRFWEKVNKDGPVMRPELGPCWLWTSSTDNHGYGTINQGGRGKPLKAHRVSFEISNGSINPELEVMHSCDNPPCVNPEHLSQGNRFDNMGDAAKKGRLRHSSDHHMSKLSVAQVKEIRSRYRAGDITQLELGTEFGVSDGTICNIVKRKSYAHIQ